MGFIWSFKMDGLIIKPATELTKEGMDLYLPCISN